MDTSGTITLAPKTQYWHYKIVITIFRKGTWSWVPFFIASSAPSLRHYRYFSVIEADFAKP